MKNKLLLAGAFAVAGFVGLTAFGGTKAEQEAQIKAAVETKLAEYTTELQDACTARVEAEAQTRYEAVVAERAAAEAAKPMPGKKPVTKPKGSKGPKVDPLPQGTKPSTKTPAEEKKSKMEGGTPNTQDKVDKMSAPAPNTDKKKAKMGGGGGK